MKKCLTAVLAGMIVLLSFSGCSMSTELSERGIVGALGIDYKDGNYLVTVLCFNTSLAESTQTEFDVEFISGEGANLHDAFENAGRATSKKLFYGHNTVLVLGRALVEQEVYDTAIYLTQNKEARLNISVFMADETAADLLRRDVGDRAHISGALEKLADGAPGGLDIKVQLFQILQQLPEDGVEGFLPIVRAVEVESKTAADSEDEERYDLAVNSIALLDHNTLKGEIEGEAMIGALLIHNRVITLTLTVYTGQGVAYALLTQSKTQISVDSADQSAILNCTGAITVRGKSNIADTTGIAELKRLFEYECARIIDDGYRTVSVEYGVDLFHIEWVLAQELSVTAARQLLTAGPPAARAVCGFSITG